jgi:hypothetical protein
VRPYFTTRHPVEQARLWRQSRTTHQIDVKIAELRAMGADYLSQCLVDAGPQHGPRVTGAIPGLSWHQWGEAVDCFWERVPNEAEWSARKSALGGGENGYWIYAQTAVVMGLTAGGMWHSLKDWPHVQQRKAGVLSAFGGDWQRVDRKMRQRWESKPI